MLLAESRILCCDFSITDLGGEALCAFWFQFCFCMPYQWNHKIKSICLLKYSFLCALKYWVGMVAWKGMGLCLVFQLVPYILGVIFWFYVGEQGLIPLRKKFPFKDPCVVLRCSIQHVCFYWFYMPSMINSVHASCF